MPSNNIDMSLLFHANVQRGKKYLASTLLKYSNRSGKIRGEHVFGYLMAGEKCLSAKKKKAQG